MKKFEINNFFNDYCNSKKDTKNLTLEKNYSLTAFFEIIQIHFFVITSDY